jgi:hypothetical protein
MMVLNLQQSPIYNILRTFLFLFWAIGAMVMGQDLETIELHHRPAEELLPLVQPFLGVEDVVIPHHHQLIVKAHPSTIRELRALIEQLDKSPHRLLITVMQGSRESVDRLNAGISVRGKIEPNQSELRLRGHIYPLEDRNTSGITQQVQTLEGKSAVIQVGRQIPLMAPALSPYGYSQEIQYRSVTTGFAVTPKLVGDGVLIEIRPWSDRLSRDQSGVIDTRSAYTTLQVALGEWVEIGGQDEASWREQLAPLSRTYSTRAQQDKIFLKVEDLDALGRADGR